MIKKIKITGAWVSPTETEIEAKKGPNAGKKFKVCKIGLFTADEDKEFGGKFIGGSCFANEKGGKTAMEVAQALKEEIMADSGKEYILDITESKGKDGKEYVNFKFPSKKELEVAKQFLK